MAVVRPRLAFSRVSTACHGKCWTSPTHRGRWYLLHSATPSWCSTSSFGPGQRLQYVAVLLLAHHGKARHLIVCTYSVVVLPSGA